MVAVFHADSKVAVLIDKHKGEWDEPQIKIIFHKKEAEKILSIPLSKGRAKDRMYWGPSKKEFFSVRSAYFLHLKNREKAKVESSYEVKEDERWRSICDLDVTGVTKLVLWKAGNDLLPTKVNLFKRGGTQDKKCPMCECPAANDIWGEVNSYVQKSNKQEDDFLLLWQKLMSVLKRNQLEEMIVLFRRIWLRRNGYVFEQRVECPRNLIISAKASVKNFQEAHSFCKPTGKESNDGQVQNRGVNLRWERPGRDYVKINWNASLDTKMKLMGIGIMIRDEKGEALVTLCDQKTNVEDATVAECIALRKAVELWDAKEVISSVKSEDEVLTCYGPIAEDVKDFFKHILNWTIWFAYREKNMVAHTLAKKALALDEEKVWIEDVPDFIVGCLNRDKFCND
ncbi:hypothetical protein CIPAW_03G206600 [Carya illinoinensis]|uniref:RNase H type-1 domain-containing protein n=1 Tax=Carya illinoinensis TaxID=32201 RepID=A0A8T1R5Z0_CARIL|nr:hypothetical protein CIPAW_03G206600 [Carya illinoinensis]